MCHTAAELRVKLATVFADRKYPGDEIVAAFAERPYPGDDAIVDRRPGCRGLEAEETWEFFRGKSWQEVAATCADVDLRDLSAFLNFDGLVYYLPAFLLFAFDVDHLQGIDDSLVFRLWSFPEEVASRLKPAEKRATVHVLEYLAGEYEKRQYVRNHAQQALIEYWAYFTDEELGLVRGDDGPPADPSSFPRL